MPRQKKISRKATTKKPSAKKPAKPTKPKKPKSRTKGGGAMVHIPAASAAVVYDGASLDDWDDEELMRGRRKNARGQFRGPDGLVIPAALHKELTRRRFDRAHDLMAESLEECVMMLRSIVNDKKASRRFRIKAAEAIMDRILGKPRESVAVDVSGEPGWMGLMVKAIVGDASQIGELDEGRPGRRTRDEDEDEEIIEGEIEEDEAAS